MMIQMILKRREGKDEGKKEWKSLWIESGMKGESL
jgi:hypothetical protein